MAWAKQRAYVVFTHDLDFGALLAATGAAGPSVLQMRCEDTRPVSMGKTVLAVLKAQEEAVDAGAPFFLAESDFAGLRRVRGLRIDLGAFEHQITNAPPSIVSSATASTDEDRPWSFIVRALDANDGDAVSLAALGLPDWIQFSDRGDGSATLIGTPGVSEIGAHRFELSATDSIQYRREWLARCAASNPCGGEPHPVDRQRISQDLRTSGRDWPKALSRGEPVRQRMTSRLVSLHTTED